MHGFNIFGFEVNTYYTEVLAKYMAGLKFEDLPKEAVEQAKLITLRILGGALEASGTAPAAAAERIAWDISTQGTATSWVSGKRMSASAAPPLSTAPPAAFWTGRTAAIPGPVTRRWSPPPRP